MKRFILSLTIGAVSTLLMVVGTASSQEPPPPPGGSMTATPTLSPSPTATPTATPPSGEELITRMKVAARSKGTAHVRSALTLTIAKTLRVVENVRSDVSWRRARIHVTGSATITDLTKSPPKTTVQKADFRLVGSRSATRMANGTWSCSTDSTQLKSNLLLLAGFLYARAAGAKNLGATTRNGTQVWHVRTTQPVELTSPAQRSPVHLYLAQSDLSVIRLTLASKATVNKMQFQLQIRDDYGSYGEKVQVTLPKVCAASISARRLIGLPLP